ncbi:hypothetical protein [Streptomyces sp. NPDC059943]|uniref:hypothetical protein n=1 Tax=Streptomyces sp. NPDC059943 TaxID=3347010 RepID=UPI0036489F3D
MAQGNQHALGLGDLLAPTICHWTFRAADLDSECTNRRRRNPTMRRSDLLSPYFLPDEEIADSNPGTQTAKTAG